MGYAIELNFDKKTSNKLKKLWTALKHYEICGFMAEHSKLPHLALIVFDNDVEFAEDDIEKIVTDFFVKEPAFELDITSIVIFPGSGNGVFLNPIVTPRLLDCHERLYKRMCDEGYEKYISEHYKPGKWVPHVTMTMNINETNMIDAIKLLRRKFKPLSVTIKQAGYLKFYPVKTLMHMELK